MFLCKKGWLAQMSEKKIHSWYSPFKCFSNLPKKLGFYTKPRFKLYVIPTKRITNMYLYLLCRVQLKNKNLWMLWINFSRGGVISEKINNRVGQFQYIYSQGTISV